MEEVAMAAKALYESLSAAEKGKIQAWFKSVDKDGDGRISISEFTSFMKGAGRGLFKLVDHSGDGFLQCDELFTLAYIQASGRPACDACGVLILGLYFTCTHCRLTNHFQDHSFDLCATCYRAKRFLHPHSEFDDNYTLLLKMQHLLLSRPQAMPGALGHPSSSTKITARPGALGDPSSSTKIKVSVLKAFKALVDVMDVIPDVVDVLSLLAS